AAGTTGGDAQGPFAAFAALSVGPAHQRSPDSPSTLDAIGPVSPDTKPIVSTVGLRGLPARVAGGKWSATGSDTRLRRRPAGLERVAGPVEIDHQRSMVRWDRLALPGLPIDLGPDGALRHRARHQEMIDPHAEILVEVARAVIPPGVATGLGAMQAIGVHQTPADKPEKGIPLLRGNVGSAVAGH